MGTILTWLGLSILLVGIGAAVMFGARNRIGS
jgi:hypothetical protein